LVLRRLRFTLRWVVLYNIRLIWLNWRLPHRLPAAALCPNADEHRRHAHALLADATMDCGTACAECGRCCAEKVDRFTAFDELVRSATDSPAPSWDRRIYSVPWMIWNGITHTGQRLLGLSGGHKAHCQYHTADGCGLGRLDRPMICVSWFCLRAVSAMDTWAMDAAEAPLRIIEDLHKDALRVARAGRRIPVIDFKWSAPVAHEPEAADQELLVGSSSE
jgi:hypothetical protein